MSPRRRAIHRDSGFQRRAAFTGDAVSDLSYVRASKRESEVIVVDDGSTDRTADVANSFAARFTVCESWPTGKIAARAIAFVMDDEANGRIVLFTDADLSAPIEEADNCLRRSRITM